MGNIHLCLLHLNQFQNRPKLTPNQDYLGGFFLLSNAITSACLKLLGTQPCLAVL